MADRNEYIATQANFTPVTTELKLQSVYWIVEDIHKEFKVFKTLAKIWLETTGAPDSKQYFVCYSYLAKKASAVRIISTSCTKT